LRAGGVHPSPVGALIDPQFGLWHAYRGALAFSDKRPLPPPDKRPSPCTACDAKPCLTACPVNAFGPESYDVPACTGHLSRPDGADCLDFGCRARHACPVGQDYRYPPDQARFHMEAFFNAHHRS